MFGSGETSGFEEPVVKRSRRIRRHQAINGQARRPCVHHGLRAFCDAGSVAVHAENEGSDRVDAALRQPVQGQLVVLGLIETFVHVFEISGVYGFKPDEYPPPSAGRDQIEQFLVLQKVDTDLSDPRQHRILLNDVAQ